MNLRFVYCAFAATSAIAAPNLARSQSVPRLLPIDPTSEISREAQQFAFGIHTDGNIDLTPPASQPAPSNLGVLTGLASTPPAPATTVPAYQPIDFRLVTARSEKPAQSAKGQVQRASWGGSKPDHSEFTDCVLDAEGNVFVAGQTGSAPAWGPKVGLIYKFDKNGVQQWGYLFIRDYSATNRISVKNILKTGDRLYFVGEFQTKETGKDVFAFTFSSSGTLPNRQAELNLLGDDKLNDAKVDHAGNLVIAGSLGTAGSSMFKFDDQLNFLWTNSVGGSRGTRGAYNHIAIGPDDAVYGAGFAAQQSDDSLAACVNSDGSLRWKVITDERNARRPDLLNDVAVDIDGNPVFVGVSDGSAPIVRKLSLTNGEEVWSRSFNQSGLRKASGRAIVATPLGVAVAGWVRTPERSSHAIFADQYSPNGTLQWRATYLSDSFGQNPHCFPAKIAADRSGMVYVSGTSFSQDFRKSEASYVAFDRGGAKRWQRDEASPKAAVARPGGFSVNDDGRIVLTGYHQTGETTQASLSVIDQTPLLYADRYEVGEMQTLTVNLGGVLNNDSFTGGGKAILVAQPAAGELTFRPDGSFTYVAPNRTSGPQSFQYAVQRDGYPVSAPTTVELVLTEVAGLPQPRSDVAVANPSVPVTIDVLANDRDPHGFPLRLTGVRNGREGQVKISGRTITYTPAANAKGTDTFTYSVSNGALSATVSVDVRIKSGQALPNGDLRFARRPQRPTGQLAIQSRASIEATNFYPQDSVF